MAELRSTTAIGGNIVWHGGNLRFEPQGQTVRYNGYKVYTEKDKPNPHTDLTTSVVQRSGDTMTGALTFDKTGEAIRINGSRLDGADAWMHIGSATYAWKLRYQGTTSGASGNEFIIESTNTAKKWSFNHEGTFSYADGVNTWTMIHTGNLGLIDGRYVNVSGDTAITGTLTTKHAANNSTGSKHLRFPSERSWNLHTRGANAAAALYLASETPTNDFRVEDNANNAAFHVSVGGSSYVNAVRELREAGQRVFSPNNRNISSSVTSSNTSVYASSEAVKSANDNANRRVAKTGDTMTGHLTFSNERGIRKDASYFLNFNSTDIHMSSIGDVIIEADSNDNETTRSLKLISGLNSLNIAGGTKNDASALKFNNHTVLHAGNYASNLDGRYINASGDTMTGDLTMTGNIHGQRALFRGTGNDYHTGGIEVLGNGSANTVFPTLGFHQAGLFAGSLQMRSGDDFRFYRQGATAYANVRANIFYGALSGNASSASKWATARTITLAGDATGSVSIDGTANTTLTVSVADDSHTHDGRYYTEAESDARFINASGDTMTGDLQLGDRRLSFSTTNLDIGLSSNGGRLCVGRSVAQGFNAGSILVSNAWNDAGKVPTNGMYVKGHVRVDGGITGNSSSASKWATARTITLAGDASGSVSIDGTANTTLTVAVANDSHTHDGRYIPIYRSVYNTDTMGTYIISKEDSGFNGSKPPGSHNGVSFISTQTHSGSHYTQLAMDTRQNALWIRSNDGKAVFDAWVRMHSDNYHPNSDKWTTARTITLNGDASGSVSIDGTANKTLTVTVADDSHTHDGRYYTEAESNSRFLYRTGGTLATQHGVSFSSINSTNDNPNRWNGGVSHFKLESSNNALAFMIGGTLNDRNAAIQMGHTSSGYANVFGILHLNPFGGGVYINKHVAWHGGNDGAGSGLDADLLDGLQASQFVRSDTGTISDARLPSTITSSITGNAATATKLANIGTTFSGKYPMVVNADGVIYSNSEVWFEGSTGKLTAPTFVGTLSGNAATASKWATARTITLAGDATGSVSIDGTANKTLTVAVANDSHTHDGRYYTEAESDSRFVNASGDTLSGVLNLSHTPVYSTVPEIKTAPITQSTYNIGTTPRFIPLTKQAALYNSGYVTHCITGLYKNNNGWGEGQNGYFVALGGNDANPTEHFTLTYGGDIKHSRGYAYWHSGNDGAGSGLDADKLDGLHSSSFLKHDGGVTDYHTSANAFTMQQNVANNIPNHAGAYPYGALVTMNPGYGRSRMYFPHTQDNKSSMYVSSGWGGDIKAWERVLMFSDGDARYLAKAAKAVDSDKLDGLHASSFARVDYSNGGKLSGSALGVTNSTPSTGHGLSLYSGAVSGAPTYGLMFAGTATFGKYGWVTSDWATYFNMNSSATRGWVFKAGSGSAGNVASISGAGNLMLAGAIASGGLTTRYMMKSSVSGSWDFRSENGKIWTFGSRNTSWIHNDANVSNGFYFYKEIQSASNITAYSDARVKTNIVRIDNALDKVCNLNGYTFDRTDVECDRQTGVIAQEVLKVLPEAVVQSGSNEDHYAVAYGNMVGLLIEAIKEERSERESLESEVRELKNTIAEIHEMLKSTSK